MLNLHLHLYLKRWAISHDANKAKDGASVHRAYIDHSGNAVALPLRSSATDADDVPKQYGDATSFIAVDEYLLLQTQIGEGVFIRL